MPTSLQSPEQVQLKLVPAVFGHRPYREPYRRVLDPDVLSEPLESQEGERAEERRLRALIGKTGGSINFTAFNKLKLRCSLLQPVSTASDWPEHVLLISDPLPQPIPPNAHENNQAHTHTHSQGISSPRPGKLPHAAGRNMEDPLWAKREIPLNVQNTGGVGAGDRKKGEGELLRIN